MISDILRRLIGGYRSNASAVVKLIKTEYLSNFLIGSSPGIFFLKMIFCACIAARRPILEYLAATPSNPLAFLTSTSLPAANGSLCLRAADVTRSLYFVRNELEPTYKNSYSYIFSYQLLLRMSQH